VTALLLQPREGILLGLDPAQVAEAPEGTVYLLHLDTPYWSLGRTYCWSHYIGFAHHGNLVARLEAHARGRGAKFTRMAREQGCTWHLARTWAGDYKTERKIKNQGGASRFCPSCGIITAAERQLLRDGLGRYVTPPREAAS
jgi:hypothetical protein